MNLNSPNNKWQDFNRQDFREHWAWELFIRNAIVCQWIVDNKSKKVLEIGSENSVILKMLKESYNFEGNYTETVYDPGVKKHLDMTKKIYKKYDCIIALEVIEHVGINNTTLCLNNIYKALSKDGYAIISTPTKKDNLIWPDTHQYEFTKDEFIKLFFTNKFSLVDQYNWFTRQKGSKTNGIIRALKSFKDISGDEILALFKK